MSKDWLPRLLDEGTLPTLTLAFAVGQSASGGTQPQGEALPFYCRRGEHPIMARPVSPEAACRAGEAPGAGSLTALRAGVNASPARHG